MSEDDKFVRSLRRLGTSVFRFLFRRDRRNGDASDGSDDELPTIFRYPPENSTDAFVIEDFEQFQESLRDSSAKTDTALIFFATSQKNDELGPSVSTVITEQLLNSRAGFVKPLLSKWMLKTWFKRLQKNVTTYVDDGELPWLPNPSQ